MSLEQEFHKVDGGLLTESDASRLYAKRFDKYLKANYDIVRKKDWLDSEECAAIWPDNMPQVVKNYIKTEIRKHYKP